MRIISNQDKCICGSPPCLMLAAARASCNAATDVRAAHAALRSVQHPVGRYQPPPPHTCCPLRSALCVLRMLRLRCCAL